MKFLLTACCSLILLLTGCSNTPENTEHLLVVGTNAEYYPYESIDTEGNVVGFDIDIAEAIANRLNRKLEIKQMSFDALILALQQDKIDIIMSGMSITTKRRETINMVPYFGEDMKEFRLAFWGEPPAGVTNLADLAAQQATVVVQTGTYQHSILNKVAGIQIKSLDNDSDLIIDLRHHKSAAALLEPRLAAMMQQRFPELTLISVPLPEDQWVLGNGIGIKKDNMALTETIEKTIKELKKEGVINQLATRWFGEAA